LVCLIVVYNQLIVQAFNVLMIIQEKHRLISVPQPVKMQCSKISTIKGNNSFTMTEPEQAKIPLFLNLPLSNVLYSHSKPAIELTLKSLGIETIRRQFAPQGLQDIVDRHQCHISPGFNGRGRYMRQDYYIV